MKAKARLVFYLTLVLLASGSVAHILQAGPPSSASTNPPTSADRSLKSEPVSGGGSNYWVAVDGSDAALGTETHPFRTIARGIRALTPGQTLVIKGGTYEESIIDTIPAGIESTKPTVVKAYAGQKVVLRPRIEEDVYRAVYFAGTSSRYIVLDGITIDATNTRQEGIKLSNGASHIRIQNCEITKARNMGLLTSAGSKFIDVINCKFHDIGTSERLDHALYLKTSDSIVDGCEIYDVKSHAIHLYGESGMSNNIFRNNTIAHCRRAIGIYGGRNNQIYNNVIFSNSEFGVLLRNDAGDLGGALVYNNTVYNSGNFGISNQSTELPPTRIINNIALGQGTDITDVEGNAILQSNLVGKPPIFVNPKAADFRLQTGSPAIDAGQTCNEVGFDRGGIRRPQGRAYDIGAYEFVPLARSVIVSSPENGEYWQTGVSRRIEWTSNLDGKVRVELSRDGGLTFETLFREVQNTGYAEWAVSPPSTDEAIIRITSVDNPSVNDYSNLPFAIGSLPPLVGSLVSDRAFSKWVWALTLVGLSLALFLIVYRVSRRSKNRPRRRESRPSPRCRPGV